MWKRPDYVPFPNVWKKFKGRKKINGSIPNFWIQDIPIEEYENVVNCMVKKFLAEDPLTKYSYFLDDQQSVEEIRGLWHKILKNKIGLVCYTENLKGEAVMAGINCTYAKLKSAEEIKFFGTKLCRILALEDFLRQKKNLFEELNADVLLGSIGLYVLTEFRGQNIGFELLRAREDLCKAVGISACVSVFSATASQILACRSGYTTLFEITFNELEKVKPEFSFPGIQNETYKTMYMYKKFHYNIYKK